jgi:hypothetical protein
MAVVKSSYGKKNEGTAQVNGARSEVEGVSE